MLFFFLSRYKNILSIIFTVTLSLSSLICGKNDRQINFKSFQEFLDLVTVGLHHLEEGISALFNSYVNYENVKKEKQNLAKRLIQYQTSQLSMEYLEKENQRLRDLLFLKKYQKFNTIEATVLSKEVDNWFGTFVLDKGSQDRIVLHMPVVAYTFNHGSNCAVVGKIIQINQHTSRLLLITSRYSQLGVILQKNGTWALVKGKDFYQKQLSLNYMSITANIQPGDILVTSGNNGIFPRGIIVGRINNNIKQTRGFFDATVQPSINFSVLEHVSIIIKKPNHIIPKWKKTQLK